MKSGFHTPPLHLDDDSHGQPGVKDHRHCLPPCKAVCESPCTDPRTRPKASPHLANQRLSAWKQYTEYKGRVKVPPYVYPDRFPFPLFTQASEAETLAQPSLPADHVHCPGVCFARSGDRPQAQAGRRPPPSEPLAVEMRGVCRPSSINDISPPPFPFPSPPPLCAWDSEVQGVTRMLIHTLAARQRHHTSCMLLLYAFAFAFGDLHSCAQRWRASGGS